jgi:hypothetical protein
MAGSAQPSRMQRYREAKEREDEVAMEEVRREVREDAKALRARERQEAVLDERRNFARELGEARLYRDPAAAEAVVRRAHKRERAPEFDPDDLVWLARQLGAWRSSGAIGGAIAGWIFGHGPQHRGLFEVAEEIAALDDSAWLDDVLLWSEPTPERWVEVACWGQARTWCHLDWFCDERGVVRPKDLSTPEARAVFAQCARQWSIEFPRKVVTDRGDAAKRSLRAAAAGAEDVGLRTVLEAWASELTP